VRMEGIASGNDRSFLCVLIDITQRKKSAEANRKLAGELKRRVDAQTAQIRLQAHAIANLTEAVVITDGPDWSESHIVFVNEAVSRITGYTARELIGRPRKILYGADTDRETAKRIGKELATGNSCEAEMIHYRKDGTPYHAQLSVAPLRNGGDKNTSFVSIHRDITERKQSEQALDQYRKDLQTMASELMLTEERERQQLAQDLHDGLGQALFRVRTKLDQLSSADPSAREIATILEEVGKMVNALTFELSPTVLRLLGLRPAVSRLATNMKQSYALSVQI